MNFNISAWAIDRPIPSIVLFVALTVLGLSAFGALPVARAPSIDMPTITVSIVQPGAAPEELESDVTRLVENAVASLTGIKHVRSTMTDGNSVTTAEFRLGVSSDAVLADVKNAIDTIRSDLPGDIDPPTVAKVDVEGQAILTYTVAAPDLSPQALSWFVDDSVAHRLQGLTGVGEVRRLGGADREILVALQPERLLALGVSAADVTAHLAAMSTNLSGGRWAAGSGEQPIRTLGRSRSAEDLADTYLNLSDGRMVRLGDLARVIDTSAEPRSFARLDGERTVVAFSVFRARGSDEVAVAARVEDALAALQTRHPEVAFTRIDAPVTVTGETFHAAMSTLVEGAVLAVIVVFLFLRDLRATIVAAAALPLSIIPTFFVLDVAGFSLNTITLLGITLVTGILVDDAIVEIENIVRHMRMGRSAIAASKEAAAEIGLAVAAISLTVAAVFVPVSFMGGIGGQYFKQFGLTVAIAVLFSLAVARLITPMMAARMLRAHGSEQRADGRAMRAYARLLGWATRHRLVVTLASLLVFVLSLFAAALLPDDLIPVEDTGRAVFALEAPPGVTLDTMVDRTDAAVRTARSVPEVRQVFVHGGVAPSGEADVRHATLIVHLAPKSDRDRDQKAVQADIRDRLAAVPDIRAWPLNENGGREVAVSVASSAPEALDAAVSSLESAMRQLPGLANVAASAGLERTEIHITPRVLDAARLGVATEAISEGIRVAAIGDVETNLPKLKTPGRLIPVRVQLDRRSDLALIRALPVARIDGQAIPLEAVADISLRSGSSSIERYDRQRRVVLGADLASGSTLGTALDAILAMPEAKSLPSVVSVTPSGDGEVMDEVLSDFLSALGTGVLLMFAILVLLFSGVRLPLVIMLSLPLSLTGAILALIATQTPVNLPVLIGILMLMGIVAKNGIMLVDFAQHGRHRGMAPVEAIIHACRTRAKPIIMTTLAMTAGMVPSALGIGGGGAFRAPMAIAVIGGLTLSTLLSLVTIPALYLLTEDIARLGGRLLRWRAHDTPELAQENAQL
ncbi:efflux RND transporter permease subunit [uncultured Martelella sp.]|uniref:efflux RND transporter permease subunit n=1 Tax=uncultured Martelella sp. TaxID=392331 RepID=UPI0029C8AAB2|nr:efflux RND transporter permease subunit [uncultured Martelella sp.]